MILSEFLNLKLQEKGWSKRRVETETRGRISNSYIHAILNNRVKQVSVEKLRLLADIFGDNVDVWMAAAGYVNEEVKAIDYPKLILDNHRQQKLLDAFTDLSIDDQDRLIDFMINFKGNRNA